MKKLFFFLVILIISILISQQILASNLEDSIIILKSDDFNQTKKTVEYIKDNGGKVDAVFIPNVLIGRLPSDQSKIKQDKNIEKISNNQINLDESGNYDKSKEIGIKVWNKRFMQESITINMTGKGNGPPGPILNDAILALDKQYLSNEKSTEVLAAASQPSYAPPNSGTSDYLYGDVLASIIFLESDGSIDSNTEDWISTEETNVLNEINNGLYWWINIKPSNVDLTIYYITNYQVPTSYEPISRPSYTNSSSGQELWIDDAMDYLGVSGSNYLTRVENYNDYLRNTYGMDWAFTIFVVDSSNDADGMFTDGKFAYAYLNGPFMVMTYDNDNYTISNMDAVTAHEFGHIFGALDQYDDPSGTKWWESCTSKFGFLQVENQNYVDGCLSNVASIMRGDVPPYTNNQIDYYAKGQVGWRDLNSNGINDAIENPYNSGTNSDSDTIIDYWDLDDDNDGILDTSDNCQFTPGITYYNGCPDIYSPIFGTWTYTTPAKTFNSLPIDINITDPSGVSSAVLYYDYGDNGVEEGTLVMTNVGSTYSATIPAPGKNYRNQNVAFYVTATDNLNYKGNSTKQLIYIENTAPTIDSFNPPFPQTINELDTINFTHTSSDLDGDTLTYKWLLDNIQKATTQNWSYITDYSSAGTHTITLEVSDEISITTQNWTINVNNINRLPVWNFVPQNQNILEDNPLSYQVSASDPDNDTIAYSVNDSSFLIDSNGLLTWTPPLNWNGNKEIIVTASDGTDDVTSTIGISVTPVNDAPIFNPINNQVVNENQLLTFIISANDVENDPLTYSASNLPSGANFDPLTQTFTWTPTYDQAGVYTVNFTVSDGQLTDQKQATITVNNVNRAPILVSNIPDQTWDEDNNININLSNYFSDPDGDLLTYSIILNSTNVNVVITNDIVTLIPNANWNGANTIQIRASDGSLTVDSNIVNLNVNSINDIPTITISSPTNNQIFTQGDIINFTGTANDIEDGDLTASIQWSSNKDGNIGNGNNFSISTLSANKHTITAAVTDSNAESESSLIIIYVNTLGNTAPLAEAGPNQNVNTNSLVTLDGNQSSDAENNTLTYLWTQTSDPTIALSDNTSSKPTFTSTQDGTYIFSLVVNDGILDSNVDTVTITSTTPITPSGGGGGSSGGGGGGGGDSGEIVIDLDVTPISTAPQNENQTINPESEQNKVGENKITGAAVGGGSSKGLIDILIILGIVVISTAGYIVYSKKINKKVKK